MLPVHALVCPKCSAMFPPGFSVPEFMNHTRQCNKVQQQNHNVFLKVPIDNSNTRFEWKKMNKRVVDKAVAKREPNEVKKLDFQEKEFWFRSKLESLRIPWTEGSDKVRLDKENILMGSLVEIEKVQMQKQIKIEFLGEKVNDAGGLLREWVHMVTKQIFDYNTGLFTFATTDETTYKLKWDKQVDEYFSGQLLYLLGVIIGKAIFERIPLTCYLDRSILRQLCGDSVKLQDIYSYDKELYNNWKYTLDSNNTDELDIYFVTYRNNGGIMQQIELLEGHKQVKVDNDNKALYIELCMQALTVIPVINSIKSILRGIRTVFPNDWLSVFEPYELEMVLYGVPFIDIQDWFDNTIYKEPYKKDHKVIRWFWDIMEKFDQDQLSRILHFCTGSTRTPINGFSRLESNRGNYSKFLIVPVPYDRKNPFPKAHTCFNRLQLPEYDDEQTLRLYLTAISKNELDGIFGLD